MKLSDLARTYLAVKSHFPKAFMNAEVCAEHDEIYIHLDKPVVFSNKDLEFLEELGLLTVDNFDNRVVSFHMYI